MTTYRCPANASTAENISEPALIGCGQEFQAEPDRHGFVECPACGMSFMPEQEPDTIQEES